METAQKNGVAGDDERLLRAVLDSLFAFVGVFSREGIVLDSNEAPVAASGLRRDQLIGRRFIDLPWFAHSANERARIAEAIAAAGRGERVRVETRVRSARDGELLCIDAAFAPLRDARGTITHVVGSGVDITARTRAEKLLAASEARLSEAQRVAHIASWEWSLVDDRVRWSDELYRIFGTSPSDYVPGYASSLSRVHPEDREQTAAVIRHAIENLTSFAFDHRICRLDGDIRVLHTRGEVMTDGTDRAARVVGTSWDITDRWEAMQKLEQTVATLRSTLEATADGILVGDQEARVAVLNQSFLALWRLPPDVKPGDDIGALARTVQNQLVDPAGFVSRVGELYGVADKEGFDVLQFADGRVYERYSKPQWVGSSIRGRVCSFRDVTQRERLLAEAQQTQEALRATTDQLRALAARVDTIREDEHRRIAYEVHDQIGQAMTALKLDLAWLRGQLPPPVAAATAARACAMDALIVQTLETARRVSSALHPAILDELGLGPAVVGLARDFERRSGVRCTTDLPAEADIPSRVALTLFRILQEALTNVARHAGARHVDITLTADRAAATLTIVDDGRGASPEELNRHLSLGLAGMRERAMAVGGELTITGSPGHGTTVVVRIPSPPEGSP